MFNALDSSTLCQFVLLLGLALGAGGTIISEVLFLFGVTKDKVLDSHEYSALVTGAISTWTGLLLITAIGVIHFISDPNTYAASPVFVAFMSIAAVLALSGLVYHHKYLPQLAKVVDKKIMRSRIFGKVSQALFASGAITLSSWVTLLFLAALDDMTIHIGFFFLIYTGATAIVIGFAERRRLILLDKKPQPYKLRKGTGKKSK